MLSRSRRDFVAAACASLLYGARKGFATETASAGRTRVACLLPLASQAFGRPADAVKRGIETAASLAPDASFDITIYATTEDPAHIAAGYTQALAEAPRLIVGPLTRNGVTALLQRVDDVLACRR